MDILSLLIFISNAHLFSSANQECEQKKMTTLIIQDIYLDHNNNSPRQN